MTSALRWGWVVSITPRPLYPRKDPVPIIQEGGWAPGPVWAGVENLALTGIPSPDRPARSESLYRLSCPGPLVIYKALSYLRRLCHTLQREECSGLDTWGPARLVYTGLQSGLITVDLTLRVRPDWCTPGYSVA